MSAKTYYISDDLFLPKKKKNTCPVPLNNINKIINVLLLGEKSQ